MILLGRDLLKFLCMFTQGKYEGNGRHRRQRNEEKEG